MCSYGKPHHEPYTTALKIFNASNNKTIVFEDSKTGILSGQQIYPKLLIGIETIYKSNELINYGCNISYPNFSKIVLSDLINNEYYINQHNNINNIIYKALKFKSKYNNIILSDININHNKLKGGNIADIIEFNILNSKYILKYENVSNNGLAIMARKLDLYNREYYFYSNISTFVPIKIPKFISFIYDTDSKPNGVILENLNKPNFIINLNLNTNNINISLDIINKMTILHSHFNKFNLSKMFSLLKTNNSMTFINDFIHVKYNEFIHKWKCFCNPHIINTLNHILSNFTLIQQNLSSNYLTLIHGDIKSPNIFYDINNNFEPYFLDWQHCAIGKGTQDLIFFIIESFNIDNLPHLYPLFINYYYTKLIEKDNSNYSYSVFIKDLHNSLCYIPFFTAIWFGTIPEDELIDKNWIYFFIQKLLFLINLNINPDYQF